MSTEQGRSDGGYIGIYTPKISPSKLYGVKMTSEWLFNSFIPPLPPKKNLYPQNKFLATPLFNLCSAYNMASVGWLVAEPKQNPGSELSAVSPCDSWASAFALFKGCAAPNIMKSSRAVNTSACGFGIDCIVLRQSNQKRCNPFSPVAGLLRFFQGRSQKFVLGV